MPRTEISMGKNAAIGAPPLHFDPRQGAKPRAPQMTQGFPQQLTGVTGLQQLLHRSIAQPFLGDPKTAASPSD